MKKLVFSILFSVLCFQLSAKDQLIVSRVEPANWWTHFQYDQVQLLVYGKNLGDVGVSVSPGGIEVEKVFSPKNDHYVFITIKISPKAKAGDYTFTLTSSEKQTTSFTFPLFARSDDSLTHRGFNSSDVIYLLMPDRFSDGDTSNDSRPGMLEKANRLNPNGRHGGDIKGIRNHLDYIANAGFTTLWINPLLENNMPEYSYHGYAITDMYRVDPRFGTNADYDTLVRECHRKGLKIIMDMVFNHVGTNHWFVKDPPMSDWIHQWPVFTKSNFRAEVNSDPHASEYDKIRMENGWFDVTMADLNQKNPYVYNYLLQNSIWWIESSGIDGIRMDTYPYNDKYAMARWAKTIRKLYPHFTIVGETWLQEPAHTAYWQEGALNRDGYNSNTPVVTDFPTQYALVKALNEKEGWTEGWRRLYYVLSEDFLYANPDNLLIFPDNHDVSRFFTQVHEEDWKYRLGITYILTTRGIPQIYYGTEIQMTGKAEMGHGFIRKDFPGGWPGDSINAFTGKGLTSQQKAAQQFMFTLLKWRKNADVIHSGKLKQFIPENNVYVYFRYNDHECVMVILNKNETDTPLDMTRFKECLNGYSFAKDIVSGKEYKLASSMTIPARSPLVLQLIK